jgi:AraC family transcriptional regulator of adaptative response / DNA-3-methyladenine glycosylase II
VAFTAGFRSVRQYHDTVRRSYGRTPSEIRARRRRDDAGGGGLALRLAYRPPLAAAGLMRFLEARAVPGLEEASPGVFRRSLRTRSGGAAVLSLSPHPTAPHVTLEVAVDEPTELGPVVQAARRLFDLDADPAAIDGALAADPALRASVAAAPGLRLPGAADPFELAVRIVIGQQVSVAGARTLTARVVAALGEALDPPAGTVTNLFPDAAVLADAPLEGIGLTRSRAGTVRRLAEAVAVGKIDLSGGSDLDDTLAALGEVPGVGPWTRSLVAMRVLRDPDAFPESDLGVRRGAEALGLPSTPAAILARAEAWRPWRGYAVMHLWRAASGPPS